ncbi:cache domain-containing protein [Acinetobacter sp. MD2(2019)]|uniref:cache domain-containing protein n=1 Tax=Acinetobacter sp. MD2(2019) TaxID=2605273 RepID=UPI002D1F33FB|nr:cache domain-containing protein [Acinetobacter sp. MD2(2019)]MEB3754504.1 PDC sensor domain-containing protein [Acinetobacter sp. MD2(2019)]
MNRSLPLEQLQRLLTHIMQHMDHATRDLAFALQEELESHFVQTVDLKQLLSTHIREQVQMLIRRSVERNEYCHGAGFACHLNAEKQKDYWILEWWFKEDNRIEQANLDQGTQQRLDFRTFEWFNQAAAQQTTHFHGPYVDYICNTAYTITAAHPIFVQQQFIGVAVIDLMVANLEKYLTPAIKALNQKVVISNSDNRVIISNDPLIRTGSIFKALDRMHEHLNHDYPIRLWLL